jgi:hypothetical protein
LKDTLHLERLGEAFLDVDTVSFSDLEDLRMELAKILEGYIKEGGYMVDSPRDQEFYFMGCKIFVMPTPYVARDLNEFIEILRKISIHSLYFHMFEARMRLKVPESDFSAWFRGMGEEELAREVSRLDPYNSTLEALRTRIIEMVKRYAKSR